MVNKTEHKRDIREPNTRDNRYHGWRRLRTVLGFPAKSEFCRVAPAGWPLSGAAKPVVEGNMAELSAD